LLRPDRFSAALALITVTGFVLRVAILFRPLRIVDGLFVPDDTYYTLTIARSLAHGHGPTTDGQTLTSGFQPLLGFVMTPVFWLTDNPDVALRIDMFVLALADTATILVLAWLAYRLTGRRPAAIISAGLWAISPLAITMALGGLETSLALLFELLLVATWIWANDAPSTRRWIVVGAMSALAVLARVDAAILVALLVGVQCWRGPRRGLIPAAATAALLGGPWWLWCWLTLGTPLPTSGVAAHKLLPYSSFSTRTMTLAVGAASGGPVSPWNWFRDHTAAKLSIGTFAFWFVVVAFIAIAVLFVLRGRSSTWALAATLPAFAACLLIFYAWYGVAFYFTRYLAPVGAIVTLVGACALSKLASSVPGRKLTAAVVGALLAIPVVAALRTDAHFLTVAHLHHRSHAELFDSDTGYRSTVLRVVQMLPPGTIAGGWQSGALSYYGGDRFTVVNLDGVVNPDVEGLHGVRLGEYMRKRRIQYIADYPYATIMLILEVSRLERPPRTPPGTTVAGLERAPTYLVGTILWP
jgi:hypothetical protein